MAYDVYRGLLSTLWDDEFIVVLDDAQALFFIFLICNPRQTPAGVFRASPEQLWSDFRREKVTVKDVREWLKEFQEAGKVVYDRGWVWVINFVRHKREMNPNTAKGMVDLLNRCPSRVIFDGWLRKYRQFSTLGELLERFPLTFCGPEVSVEYSDTLPPVLPKIKAEKPEKHLFEPAVRDVWACYEATMHVKATLTDKRRDKIISRFKDKITDPVTGEVRSVTVDDLKAAIRACALSDFHMGREHGHEGKVFNTLEDHILKSQEQFEKWLQKAPRPRPRPVERPQAPPEAQEPPEEPQGPPVPLPAELRGLVDRVSKQLDANRPREAPKESVL